MSLADWQISLISASIGTAIGTVIPFIFVFWRDRHDDEKRKHQIREALCSELVLAEDTLKESLNKGKEDEKRQDGLFVSSELPVFESFPLSTTFYNDIAIEALATTVNSEALKNLQSTYNLIYHFNSKRLRVIGGFWTEKSTVSALMSQIDKTIQLIKEKR